jgi:hypothetical protein
LYQTITKIVQRRFFWWIPLFFGFFVLQSPAWAQDPASPGSQADTTKKTKKDSVKYGPNTVFFFYEDELYRNRERDRNPDTLLDNRHRYNAIQANANTWQDLGVNGQATAPIFYQMPLQIGTRQSLGVYDWYQIDPAQVKHFNSYSPYTDVDYVQGGKGRPRIRILLSRSVRPNWSFTLHFRRMEANRIFNRVAYRNDAIVANQTYGAQTRYFSPRGRYKLLAGAYAYEHSARENGGYTTNATVDTIQDLGELARLEDTELRYRLLAPGQVQQNATALPTGRQSQFTFRLYHQFDLFRDSVKRDKNQLQLFHLLEVSNQRRSYTDERWQANLPFYGRVAFATDRRSGQVPSVPPIAEGSTVAYGTQFRAIDNRAGIKGKFSDFRYRAYARLRQYRFVGNYVDSLTARDTSAQLALPSELFVGGGLDYTFGDSSRLEVDLEYLLVRDYRLAGAYVGRWFTARFEQALFAPDLQQRRSFGTFFRWDNSFRNTFSNRATLSLNQLKVPFLPDSAQVRFTPSASFTNVTNHVWFDSTGRPQQADTDLRMVQVGAELRSQWRSFHHVLQATYSQNLRADLVRMPRLIVNNQLYWERKDLFGGVLSSQLGLDVMWKSSFVANAYLPQLQQFVLQDRFEVDNFVMIDAFFNFKISRFIAFIKVNNLGQGLLGRGYFNTPRYFAQPRSLELGINWMFFD